MSSRIERDSFGPIDVPADRLWGAQTQRSLEHFHISTEKMPPELIAALATVKRAGRGTGASGARVRATACRACADCSRAASAAIAPRQGARRRLRAPGRCWTGASVRGAG